MYSGKFITFEGGEGCGKSTQVAKLLDNLQNIGVKAMTTREIGGTIEAEKIRDLVVHNHLHPMSELMLIMAARYEHLANLIMPALRDGYVVICDRYVDSTAVYQTINSSLTADEIYKLHAQIMRFEVSGELVPILPELTFFLDLDAQQGLNRAKDRGETNKFEDFDLDYHRKVSEQFRLIASQFSRIETIKCGDMNPGEIAEIVFKSCQKKIY